jgi:hypothetical protein
MTERSDGELLRKALAQTCSALPAGIRKVHLEHWNESTFRFLLVSHILALAPDTKCWSEWNRVDLVLPASSGATLVELKFFTRQPLRDLSGRILRYKGGPSLKNVGELEHALATLAVSRTRPWVRACGGVAAAYLVLAYCDPVAPVDQRTYGASYRELPLNRRVATVETIAEELPIADGVLFTCKLLSVRLDRAA